MPTRWPHGRKTILRFLAAALCVLSGAVGLDGVAVSGERGIVGPPGILGGGSGGESGGGMAAGLLGEGIDFTGGMLDWEEDESGHRVAILRNYARVILPQVTISARNMVLNVELQEIYAEGDVVFDEPAGNSFYCDQLTFNYQEWTGLAKNIRIRMDRADAKLPVRDFLDEPPSLNLERAQSLGGQESRGPLRRMYVQAQELRAHDSETFELIDAKITPDAFARPKWYFRSPAALLRRQEKIESYHNTVNIGRFPVLYFPYIIRDLQYDWPWMTFSAGYTSEHGTFARTQWGWRIRDNPTAFFRTNKVIFDVDYFSQRGTGLGMEFDYQMGRLESIGKLKVYGVYEHAIDDGEDHWRASNANDNRIYYGADGNRVKDLYRRDFRWAVDWEHYQQLNDLWDLRAEAHLYHDRDYLKDYDEARYWSEKEPESWIDLRRLDKNWELEFVAQDRLTNKWQTQAGYYPEMRLTVPGLRLGSLPLYFKNDLRVGVVDKYFDEDAFKYDNNYKNPPGIWGLDNWGLSTSRLWNDDHFGTFFRAVNDMRVEAPIQVADAFTVKPWVGLTAAYYSKTMGDSTPDDSDIFKSTFISRENGGDHQLATPFGVDLTTRAYTLMGANEQWRLITEPVVSYLENPTSRLDYYQDIYPVDEFDVYYKQRRFGFELRNRLQRRYYENAPGSNVPEHNILDFNMRFYYYPRRDDRDRLNYGRKVTEVNVEAVFRPTSRFSLSASADYDTRDSTINKAILSADWRLSNMFRITANHYHYRGRYWRYPGDNYSDQTYLAFRTKLWNDSSHYALETAILYEWRGSTDDFTVKRTGVRHGLSKYRVSLFRDLDTFEMSVSYVRNHLVNDHGIYFTLSPKNFMGMERPQPAYSPGVEDLAEGRYPDAGYQGSGIEPTVVDADLKDVQF